MDEDALNLVFSIAFNFIIFGEITVLLRPSRDKTDVARYLNWFLFTPLFELILTDKDVDLSTLFFHLAVQLQSFLSASFFNDS